VYTYKAQDVHWEFQEKQGDLDREEVVYSTVIKCGQDNCPAQVKLFAVVGNGDKTTLEILEEFAGRLEFDSVLCGNNHLLHYVSQNFRRPKADPSWLEPE